MVDGFLYMTKKRKRKHISLFQPRTISHKIINQNPTHLPEDSGIWPLYQFGIDLFHIPPLFRIQNDNHTYINVRL